MISWSMVLSGFQHHSAIVVVVVNEDSPFQQGLAAVYYLSWPQVTKVSLRSDPSASSNPRLRPCGTPISYAHFRKPSTGTRPNPALSSQF